MKEIEYLKTIKNVLTDSSFLGDDCAFLPPSLLDTKGLYITQDTLVEDVHFTKKTITPYQLGQKSINVNLSDLASNCAKPLFLTISLSLPKDIDNDFVKEFYKGINDICKKHNIKVVGGDLTGSDKIIISICAIGKKVLDMHISRQSAKVGDVVFTTGFHGDSAGGLEQLKKELKKTNLTNAHLNPIAQLEKSEELAKSLKNINIKEFAMMDTSDGLADAMYRIAKDSDVTIECDFDAVPISNDLQKEFPNDYKKLVLWGGEDFQLLGCLPHDIFETLDKTKFFKIGIVKEKNKDFWVKINLEQEAMYIDEKTYTTKSFNHFED